MYVIYRQAPLTGIAAMSDILQGQRWPEEDPGVAIQNEEFQSNNQDLYLPEWIWIDGQCQISILNRAIPMKRSVF